MRQRCEAQQAFQKSIDANGGHYAEPQFGLSALLCNQQKFTEAEPIIRKALELAPGFNPGHLLLAWALFGLNRLDEAEKIAHEASIRDPKLALAHLLLANIYNRRSDCSAMLVELDAYPRLEPDGPLSDQVREAQDTLSGSLPGLSSSSRRHRPNLERIHSSVRMNASKAIDEVDRLIDTIHQSFLRAGPRRKTVITWRVFRQNSGRR